MSSHIQFSQKFDLYTLTQHSCFFSQARIDGAYKQKSQKVQPIDLNLPMDLSLMGVMLGDWMLSREKSLFLILLISIPIG